MKDVAGWYVDPDDDGKERYWNGSMWQPGSRRRRDHTPYHAESAIADDDSPDRGSRHYTNELLEEILVAQRRSTNYLAVLTYITVVLLVLGVTGVVIGVLAARS